MNKSKLNKTAEMFVKKTGEHCILLTFNKNGTSLEGVGDDAWVNALGNNPELLEGLTNALVEAEELRDEEKALEPATFPKNLPRLFATPGSKLWKGVKIRSELSTYLGLHGFGHNMARRYGEGHPPQGWPVQVDWSNFKGPSKGCSLTLCTEIICQLLEAQGINPANHGPMEDDAAEESIEEDDYTDDEPIEPSNKSNEGDEGNEGGNTSKRKRNINELLDRQAREERNLSAYERRRQNMKDIDDGLRALEGDSNKVDQEEVLGHVDQEDVLDEFEFEEVSHDDD